MLRKRSAFLPFLFFILSSLFFILFLSMLAYSKMNSALLQFLSTFKSK